jgi:hypothetical protein
MSERQALEFSHAIAKPVDAPAIDLQNWLLTLSEADHAACRRGHRAIGGVGDGTRAGTSTSRRSAARCRFGTRDPAGRMSPRRDGLECQSRLPHACFPVTVGMIRDTRGRAGRSGRAPPLRGTGRSAARRARARLTRGDARFRASLRRRGDARAMLPARLRRDGDGVHPAAPAML